MHVDVAIDMERHLWHVILDSPPSDNFIDMTLQA